MLLLLILVELTLAKLTKGSVLLAAAVFELALSKAAALEVKGTSKAFGQTTSGTPWAAEEEAANVVEVVVIKLLL